MNENEELDLSGGLVPHHVQMPTHPAGTVTAFDQESGLPIVMRKPAGKADESEAKPQEPKPEEPKPAQSPKPKLLPADPELAKGKAVTLQDGTRGTIKHMVNGMQTARVKTEDGRNITVPHKSLTPATHVVVQSHIRALPGKSKSAEILRLPCRGLQMSPAWS